MLSQALRRLGQPTIAGPRLRAGRARHRLARPGSSGFSPSRPASSPSGAGSTPPGCATVLGFGRATPPRRRSPTSAARSRRGLLPASRWRRPRPRRARAEVAVADAEVIPFGTRGKPGRGTGSGKPSSAARTLAGSAAGRARRPRRADARPSPPTYRRERRPASPSRPRAPATAEDVEPAPTRPPEPSAPADGPRAHPTGGIPVGDWLHALTSAAAGGLRRPLGAAPRRVPGLPPPPGHRRLRGRRVRLRRRGHRAVPAGRAAPARGEVVPRRGPRRREHPGRRWRAGGVQPLRHGAGRRPDDDGVRPRHHRPLPAPARGRPGLPAAGRRRAGPQGRRDAGLQRGRRADAPRRRAGRASGPRASRASASPSPSATSCSASAVAASCRRRCAPACPIVPCSVVGAEEIYPLVGNVPALARLLGMPVPADHPVLPAGSARSGWCRCRRSG